MYNKKKKKKSWATIAIGATRAVRRVSVDQSAARRFTLEKVASEPERRERFSARRRLNEGDSLITSCRVSSSSQKPSTTSGLVLNVCSISRLVSRACTCAPRASPAIRATCALLGHWSIELATASAKIWCRMYEYVYPYQYVNIVSFILQVLLIFMQFIARLETLPTLFALPNIILKTILA